MLISALITELQKEIPIRTVQPADEREIVRVTALPEEATDDAVYAGHYDPGLALPAVCLLDAVPTCIPEGCAVYVTSPRCIIEAAMRLQRILDSDYYIDKSVLKALLLETMDKDTMQDTIDGVAQLVNNALILLDSDMRVIAYSKNYEITDPLWATNIERGYCDRDFLQRVRNNPQIRSWKRNNSVQSVTLEGDRQPKLVTFFTQQGHIACSLVMIEHHSRITENHRQMLPLICRMMFLLYSTSTDNGYDNVSVCSGFLFKLLDSKNTDELASEAAAQSLELPERKRVVVARFVRRTENRNLKRTLALEMSYVFPNGYIVQYKSYVMVLTDAVSDEQKKALAELAQNDEVAIGISWEFAEIRDLRLYFNQAVSCIKQAESFCMENNVFEYDEFYFWDLLYNYTGRIPLEQFIMPEIVQLKEHDVSTKSNLLPTLKAYLKNEGSLSRTGSELYIHKNTLIYRIKRIEELCGINLSDMELRSRLRCSLSIYCFLNKIQ